MSAGRVGADAVCADARYADADDAVAGGADDAAADERGSSAGRDGCADVCRAATGAVMVVPPGTAPAVAEGPLANIAPGGAISPQFGFPAGPEPLPGIANPILVPVTDDQMAWDQIVDVVSDYFRVTREQQARRSGEAWSEGRIETQTQSGATVLEPQRGDSVGWFNRWESTFQSIRRTAVVRVIPDPNGYQVEVVVQKELEDLPQPQAIVDWGGDTASRKLAAVASGR